MRSQNQTEPELIFQTSIRTETNSNKKSAIRFSLCLAHKPESSQIILIIYILLYANEMSYRKSKKIFTILEARLS
jgi:hypothetical protein